VALCGRGIQEEKKKKINVLHFALYNQKKEEQGKKKKERGVSSTALHNTVQPRGGTKGK